MKSKINLRKFNDSPFSLNSGAGIGMNQGRHVAGKLNRYLGQNIRRLYLLKLM